MRIAILGARGIPARYSGYDTLAEELAGRLAGRHRVTVYCRRGYYAERPRAWRGVRLVHLPAPRAKGLESLLHSGLATLHLLLSSRPDAVLFLDPANAPFVVLLGLLGRRVAVHTDGLGWARRKWGRLARRYYRWVEGVCARRAAALVTDNPAMREYYLREYGTGSWCLAYGAECGGGRDEGCLAELGLAPGGYLLVVARLEPENNTDLLLQAFRASPGERPLVVVGDAPYGPAWRRRLEGLADGRVRFLGRLHDQRRLNALFAGAWLYLHGHEVGGTNPSLVRALGAGAAVAYLDCPFNREVVGAGGFPFRKDPDDLRRLLEELPGAPERLELARRQARERAGRLFSWERVAAGYEALFAALAAGRTGPPSAEEERWATGSW